MPKEVQIPKIFMKLKSDHRHFKVIHVFTLFQMDFSKKKFGIYIFEK